jgi:hypothetical protein
MWSDADYILERAVGRLRESRSGGDIRNSLGEEIRDWLYSLLPRKCAGFSTFLGFIHFADRLPREQRISVSAKASAARSPRRAA